MASHQILKQFWPNFNATKNDLKNPTQNFLMRFYETFFEECALAELLMEPIPTDKVLYPALIKDTLPIISYCVMLKKIFSMIKGSQFGLEDIIEPNPKRTSKQIEMLINFLAYVDCHAGLYSTQALADSDNKVLEKEALTKEIDELKEKLNECAMNKAKFTSELKSAEESKLSTLEYLNVLLPEKAKTDGECDVLNGTVTEKKNEIKMMEIAIQKEMEEIQALKEKIILSPDAVSRQKAELIIRKREVEGEHMHHMSLVKEKNRFETQLEQLITMIQSKLSQVQDLGAKLTFSRDLEKGLEIDEAALRKPKEKLEAVSKEMQAAKKQLLHLDEEEKEFEKQCINIRSSMEKSLQQILKDKIEAEDKQIKQGAKQVLIAQEMEQWKEKIMSNEEEKDKFLKFFTAKEEEIINSVKNFDEQLETQIGVIKNNFSK